MQQTSFKVVAFCVFVMALADLQLAYIFVKTYARAASPGRGVKQVSSTVGQKAGNGPPASGGLMLTDLLSGTRWLLESGHFRPGAEQRQELLSQLEGLRAAMDALNVHEKAASGILTAAQANLVLAHPPRLGFSPTLPRDVKQFLQLRASEKGVHPDSSPPAPAGHMHLPVPYLMHGVLMLEDQPALRVTPTQAEQMRSEFDAVQAASTQMSQRQAMLANLLGSSPIEEIRSRQQRGEPLPPDGPRQELEAIQKLLSQTP